jgi:proteasome assembly chaperone 3
MPILSLTADPQDLKVSEEIEVSPFPAKSKQAAGLVDGTETDISCLNFADKILITVSQGGRLSQWVCSFASL